MSAGWTPGPWVPSVEPHTYAAGKHWYVVVDTEENGIGEFYGDDHETNAANLRMAAAAPELYEACEAAEFLLAALCVERDSDTRVKLRSAIAKVGASHVDA